MYYDQDDINSENETEGNNGELVRQKQRGKRAKQSDNKSNKKIKQSSSKKSSNKSKTSSIKKSRAIIEDDDDDDDDLVPVPPIKSNLNDEDDEDEEEEDDEEAVKEEFNDFIDDNLDEDEDEESEEQYDNDNNNVESDQKTKEKKSRKKKSKKKKKKKGKSSQATSSSSNSNSSSENSADEMSELEEEDLDLIKNNLNLDDLEEVGIATKKRRRIKIASESSTESGDDVEKRRKTNKDKRKQLRVQQSPKKQRNDEIDEDDEEEIEEQHNKRSSGGSRSNANYESDEEGSFIVDDTDDEAKNGSDYNSGNRDVRSSRDKNQVRKKRVYNDEAQQEALDIFGVNAEELGAVSDESGEQDDEEYDEDLEEEIEEVDDDENERDDEDEDGDLTQNAAKKRQRQRRLKVMHKMEDIFEPQELEKNLLTEFDQQVRIEDKPERFMLRNLPVTSETNDFELEREAIWIYNQVFQFKKTVSQQETIEPKPFNETVPKIKEVLNFIRNECFEVPFIGSYRKEYIEPELTMDDLWKVYEYDEKYCQLKLRKENLLKLFERMSKFQIEEQIPQWNKIRYKKVLLNENDDEVTEVEDELVANKIDSTRIITEQDLTRIQLIQSTEEFLDCYQHFNLHYSSDMIAMKEFEFKKKLKAHKKPIDDQQDDVNLNMLDDIDLDIELIEGAKFTKFASRKDRLFHCRQAGLDKFVRKYGLTCEQYGENLVSDYPKNEIEQCTLEPRQIASEFIREPYFQTEDQVLNAANYMLSIQLARDPTIRQYVRELYMQKACITVRPTMPRGFKEIDETHLCFPFKYLKDKPCAQLKEDEYLKISMAEQDNLITVKFDTLKLKEMVVVSNDQEKESTIAPRITNDDDWDDDTPATIAPAPNPISTLPKYTTIEKPIIDKLRSFFEKDGFSSVLEQWNLLRFQAIEDMYYKYLFPDFEKELRAKLIYEAKQYVFNECQKRLNFILKQGPFKPQIDMDQNDGNSGHLDYNNPKKSLKVIAITFTTNEMDENGGKCLASVAVASFVNGAGELEEFIRIRNFNLRLNQTLNPNSKRAEFINKEREEKLEDLAILENFIAKKTPNLIVINNESKDALIVLDDVKYAINTLIESKPEIFANLRVEIVDNEKAKLFEACKQSEELGQNLPGLVKQGIGLARYVQDPLLCYTQLCNHERDILAIKFHPMQQSILSLSGGRHSEDSNQLMRKLEIEFINRVNEVGVDLNRCNQCPHTANCLQFVAGLGPRKAQHIIKVLRHQRSQLMLTLGQDKQIKTYPVATNRLFLVTKCVLGRRVFVNCAGFIKFDVDSISKEIDEDDEDKESSQALKDESKYTEILDSTRIHPETYEWARKMAVDALDIEENENEANANTALKEILENPKRLKDLDLDAFAAELERTGNGKKNLTLYDIRKELMCRYKDKRTEFYPLSDEEKFYSFIKETPYSFYPGKLVTCRCVGIARRRPNKEQLDEANPVKDDDTCMWQCSFCKRNDFSELGQVWSHFDTGECPGPPVGVRVFLDNGCNGFIPLKFISDSHVTNPEDRIKIGMTIHARITRIDPERFSVELTCRSSDLRDSDGKWKGPRDECFDYATEEEDKFKTDEKKRKEENRQTYNKRIIAHPQFKNIGYAQAVAHLRDMGVGDAVIRPSSKGNDHLTVTWKLDKNCFQHVDVLEEKKQNSFSIGKRLIIEGEDYEDLDEILARYINPMASFVREISSHKNYKDVEFINSYMGASQMNNTASQIEDSENVNSSNMAARNDQIEHFLLDERSKNSARIPYLFTCCRNLPGRFMLSYMIKTKLRNEYIKIIPEGFKFREKTFSSFNELVNWFKVHFSDPIPIPPPRPIPTPVQSMSNQMSQMSMNNQNIKTPNYSSSGRTPLQQSNFNEADMPPPMFPDSNENKKTDYSSGRGGYRGNGRGNYRGRGGTGAGYYRGRGGTGGRGGFNQNLNPNNNWNSQKTNSCMSTSNEENWDEDSAVSKSVSYSSSNIQPVNNKNNNNSNNDDWNDNPKTPSYNNRSNKDGNDENWDDDMPSNNQPVQAFQPKPTYQSNNRYNPPIPPPVQNKNLSASNEENWDDDMPSNNQPVQVAQPIQEKPTYQSNNRYNPPVQNKNLPARNEENWDDDMPSNNQPIQAVQPKPTYQSNNRYNPPVQNKNLPARNEENWDDDMPSNNQPIQAVQPKPTYQSNNRYNPPIPPPVQNKNLSASNEENWDDDMPSNNQPVQAIPEKHSQNSKTFSNLNKKSIVDEECWDD